MKATIFKETLFFSATAILGPILLLGGLGYILDNHFGTGKVFLFSGLGLAFVTTQILMFRKVKQFSRISKSSVKPPEPKESDAPQTQEVK